MATTYSTTHYCVKCFLPADFKYYKRFRSIVVMDTWIVELPEIVSMFFKARALRGCECRDGEHEFKELGMFMYIYM